jgi:L-aminopeptidase/D-esterase-like protein
MALRACRSARAARVPEGSVGAGTGATVGKYYGMPRAMKGGLGIATLRRGRLTVGALAVVNAFGDVRHHATGDLLAGARDAAGGKRLVGIEANLSGAATGADSGRPRPGAGDATTLALVATNALLTREQACRLASASQVALARSLSPAHTAHDGDLVYALSTGNERCDALFLEAMAVEALGRAIVRGVTLAHGWRGIPAWRDLRPR